MSERDRGRRDSKKIRPSRTVTLATTPSVVLNWREMNDQPAPPLSKGRSVNVSGTGRPTKAGMNYFRNRLERLSAENVLDQAKVDPIEFKQLADSSHPLDWHRACSMILHSLEEQARARLFLVQLGVTRPKAYLRGNPTFVAALARKWLFEAYKGHPPDALTGIDAEYSSAMGKAPPLLLDSQSSWRRKAKNWCRILAKQEMSRLPYRWPGLQKSSLETVIVLTEFLSYTTRHQTIPTKAALRRIIFKGEDDQGVRVHPDDFYTQEVNGKFVFPDDSAAGMFAAFRSAGLQYLPRE